MCVLDICDVGWDVINRPLTDIDAPLIVSGQAIPCEGIITEWHYWSKTASASWQVAVLRSTSSTLSLDVIGINNVADTMADQLVIHTVPHSEWIQVQTGDYIAFSADTIGKNIIILII